MIRFQAQLTERQARGLRELAAQEGVSVAELLRRGADIVLRGGAAAGPAERRKRALAVVGAFASGHQDVSREHDRELDEIYGPS